MARWAKVTGTAKKLLALFLLPMTDMKSADNDNAVESNSPKQQQFIDRYMVLRVSEGVKPHVSQRSQHIAVPRLECHPNGSKIVGFASVYGVYYLRLLCMFTFKEQIYDSIHYKQIS
jgi:hypothetical protein